MAPHAVFVYELWNELNILFNQDELHHVLLLPFRNHSANSKIWCQPFRGQNTIAGRVCFVLGQPNGDLRPVVRFTCSGRNRVYHEILTYWANKIDWCVRIILHIVLGWLLKKCVIRWL